MKEGEEESLLAKRRKLYGVYSTDKELQQDLDRYVVQQPPLHPSSEGAHSANPTITVSSDIWGNYPEKEPKYLVLCKLCGLKLGCSRFANHLDKCLGLGGGRNSTGRTTLPKRK